MAQANRAAGAALERQIRAEMRRKARVHEIERRFGYYGRAAEGERGRR